MSSRKGSPAYVEDYDETTGTIDRNNRQVASTKKVKKGHRETRKPGINRQVASTKKPKGHREFRKPKISFSDAQYPGESSSRDAPAVEEKVVRVERRKSFGSDDPWGSDPGSASYSCGETPPLRPNRASSENLDQDIIKPFMFQENADTAPDKKAQQTKIILARGDKGPEIRAVSPLEPNFSGGMMSAFTAVDAEPAARMSKRGGARPRKSKEQKQAEKDSAEAAQAAIDALEEPPPLPPAKDEPKIRIKLNATDPKEPTTSGFAARLYRMFKAGSSSPSGLPPNPAENKLIEVTWGPTTVIGGVKETVVSTQPPSTVIWGPTTVLGRILTPPIGAPGTRTSFLQDLDSDDSSTQSTDNYSEQTINQNRRIARTQRRNLQFSTPESATSRFQSEPAPMAENESRKQTSRGTRDSHITNSELLEDAEIYEQTQPRSGESKREAEFLLDEQIQQQEDEIRGPLDVPTVSYRITPDGITYSTSLNSDDGDSDHDDAVLHPKTSSIAIPSSPPRGHPWQFIRDSEDKVAALPSFQTKVTQPLMVDELEFVAANEKAEHITRLATILESKRDRTNSIAHTNGAGQLPPGTVPIATASQGQATDMLDDSPNPSQYVRENEFQGVFTPSYLPLLDGPSPNERRSSATEDERETGLWFDGEPLPLPPFYRSVKSENHMRRKRQPSPAPSLESLQSLVDSIFSLASLSSASTAPGSENAFQRVLAILQADAVLKDLYIELTARTSAIKFKRNFGILLKRFAVDLERESRCYNEQRTAKFIRSRARKIAQRTVDAMYPSVSTIEGAQISMALAKTNAESSEDSETDEEPDEYLELENFVTNSRSFQELRDNIRGFLGLELGKLLAELPFVDENQLVEPESINSGQNALSCRKTVWSMPNFRHKIRDLLFSEPPIPNGLTRVRWKCPCGETLYDDYQELKPGAAKRMEDYLRRSSYKRCAGEPKSLTERISNTWSSFKGLKTFVTPWSETLKNNRKTTIVDTELRYYSDARTTRTPAHTSGEVFYLLLCHNSGVGAEVVKLRQPDICDINNDQKLFSFLHEEYLTLRKRWWTWISLWTLQSIKFVRFELYENELVDVRKLDDVPPPTKDNEYRHGPPNPPELNPPLGSTLLMHLFKHPELAGTKKKCLQKIPRKLRNRLVVLDADDDAIGWGLQFIEGWSKKRLMYMTALTFGLSSVVVMVLVSILGHDVQNAGAIASFMLSFVTIGIATAQAAMHMN